jgi:hypothetical protein
MIKFILSVVIVLALIGGAIKPVSTEESWMLVVNKEAALSSVQNGAMTAYDFIQELMKDADTNEMNEVDAAKVETIEAAIEK